MSRISVAMTTYNGAKFLAAQLQSLLDQTRQPDEVVICDDRSQDDTVEIAKRFISENRLDHWRVLENGTNLGYVRNFRRAMAAATGDIVFLSDQDDIWCADKLAVMLAVMEQNPQIEALVCGYSVIDAEGKKMEPQPPKFYVPSPGSGELSRMRSGKVLYANMAQGCAGAYRRSIVDAYCRAEECNVIAHDWALHMLAYERKGLYFLNRELIQYRIHTNNTTGTVSLGRVDTLQKDLHCLENGKLLPVSQASRKEIDRITDFYRLRIHSLQSARPWVWLGGGFRFFPLITRSFFFQYMKDFMIILRREILAKQ